MVSFGPGLCGKAEHPVGLTRISGDMLGWVRGVVGRYDGFAIIVLNTKYVYRMNDGFNI